MRYLVITTDFDTTEDYSYSCIRDEFGCNLSHAELELPKDLGEKIRKWHINYQRIIPMDLQERQKNWKSILELDRIGIGFVNLLREAIQEEVKVSYFSEGQGKRLYK